jgi:hypothetical protein
MRIRWMLLALGAIVVLVMFAFPLWWPAVNRSPLDTSLPGLAELPPEEQPIIEQIALEDVAFAEVLIATGLAEPMVVPLEEQAAPVMQVPTLFTSGEFEQIDAVRWAKGNVLVYQQADESWVIRFEDFEVRNGPQLHLFLSANPQPRTPEQVREGGLGFDWGPLKGAVGSQNYELPAGFDMSQVGSVVIYSVTYQKVFSSAQLF